LRKLLREIKLITALALLWLTGGAAAGVGFRAYFHVAWVAPCALISLVLGMILLLVVMRDDKATQRLYGETDEDMPLKLGLAALFVLPVVLILVGLIWLLTAPLLPR
jgi:hypothetical protein